MSEDKRIFCPVILAGGGGTRLWPLSREHYPKQFLSFQDENSMLQQTLARVCTVAGDFENADPLLICNEEHRFLVEEHATLIGITPGEIILEPLGRNTAPALTIAAIKVLGDDPVLLIAPADHLITDIEAFQRAVTVGFEAASVGKLVTFGVAPTSPETGFGYIQAGDLSKGETVQLVNRFVEKPDLAKAIEYVESGEYFWNSGIFMMKASVWLEAIRLYEPHIYTACQQVMSASGYDGAFYRLDNSFAECPPKSIDYAVMERVCEDNMRFSLVMVPMDPGWSDLGSWSALYDINEKDNDNNVTHGNVLMHETRGSIIHSHDRLVATFGCENMLVIETADAVLVGSRDNAQDVKHLVTAMKQQDYSEAIMHRRVYRPWGSYESLDTGEHYQVKRLIVNPGKKLSLQLHHHRAEHWVVVTGTATVTRGNEVFELQVNESTFIPPGEKHRLENCGDSLLEVIEVQSGAYLGEDDIVRFDDDFGRHNSS